MRSKTFFNKTEAKLEFRSCMDRLTRDLKLYRISPQDLIKVKLHNVLGNMLNIFYNILDIFEDCSTEQISKERKNSGDPDVPGQ